MTKQKTPKEALDAVADDWKKTTQDQGGPEKLLPVYQASIGYSK